MTRSRKSAKDAGTRFASHVSAWLAGRLGDGGIERRATTGALDRGDITGLVTSDGRRVIAECKDYGGRYLVGEWLKEAQTEARNDRAAVGVVIAKRRGTTDPGDQVVFTTVRDLAVLLGADRDTD